MNEKKKNGLAMAAVAALIIGGVIGYVARGSASDNGNSGSGSGSSATAQVTGKASDLRATLNATMREHAALAAPLIMAKLNDSPDAEATQAAMDKNTNAIADAVGSVYSDKKDEFATLWRQHLTYYDEYINATKSGDEAGKETAKANLATFADKLSGLFSSANPELKKDTLKAGISEHGEQTLALIDQIAAKDFEKAYESADMAYMHMGDLADMLAEGIVKQSPDKF